MYISTETEGHVTVAIIDELWTEFQQTCETRGWFPAATRLDWGTAAPAWRILDGEQKMLAMQCIRGCERPFLVGESLPANFLRDRKFLRPAPRAGRTVVPMSAAERERHNGEAMAHLEEQIKRSQYDTWKREQLAEWVRNHVDPVRYESEVRIQARKVSIQYRSLPAPEIARVAECWARIRWENQAKIPTYEEWKNVHTARTTPGP